MKNFTYSYNYLKNKYKIEYFKESSNEIVITHVSSLKELENIMEAINEQSPAGPFTKYEKYAQYLNDKRKNNFLNAIHKFNEALINKEIYNADFKFLYTYDFGRNIELIFDEIQKADNYYAKMRENNSINVDIWHVVSAAKIARSFNFKTELPIIAEFIETMKDIRKEIDEVKKFIVMGRKPKPADPNAFVKPTISVDHAKYIEKIVRGHIEKIHKEFEKDNIKRFMEDIEKTLNTQKDDYLNVNSRNRVNFTSFSTMMRFRILDNKGYGKPFELKSDWKTIIKNEAIRYTDQVINEFIGKQVQKLALIVAKRKDEPKVKLIKLAYRNGMMENIMNFSFEDKSSFQVYSQVETSVSSRGVWFFRYPTRFSNIILSNGEKMKNPSEEKMIKEF